MVKLYSNSLRNAETIADTSKPQIALTFSYIKSPMPVSSRICPFLKWAGGKKQLLPELNKYVPETYRRYIEPFVGAGALFFSLRPQDAILGDLNEELINAYKVVRDDLA